MIFARVACELIFIISVAAASIPLQQHLSTRAEIGPNVRVSSEQVPHIEPYIAAHPTDSNNLIISVSRSVKDKGIVADAFFTADGGKTWIAAPLPRMQQTLSEGKLRFALDNWVAYSADGTAYYSSLLSLKAQPESPIWVYRSGDRGKTWQEPAVIPGRAIDHPAIVATGRGADKRLYIAALASGRDSLVVPNPVETSGIAVFRSDDGGLSFKTSAFIAPDNLGHNAMNPLVLPDGSLLVTYIDFPNARNQQLSSSRVYAARSGDGGYNFGLPQFVAERSNRTDSGFSYGPQFAVDLSNSRYRGRVYAVWNGPDKDGVHTYVIHSSDSGRTWSARRVLKADGAGHAVFAALAVSSNGTVGVVWIQDEKVESKPHSYRAYFAASTDGGETFTQAYTLSDAISQADSALNKETRCPT
ncbi:MAG: glycoside hydrolase [Blastocatellia bacterium]|nr:glycoside hydrolase [Blastocatellia bacterium]